MAGVDRERLEKLQQIAHKIRILSIESTKAAGSGHPTSCASIAEILSVLFFDTMKYKLSAPRSEHSDRFILSKGHAAPALYAAWVEAGLFPASDLMNLRKIDSDLEGHPTPRLNFIDAATGSLGQGLSFAAGMAYVGKYIDKASYRTYCLIGDGESAEGSIWEAIAFGSHYKLDNMVAIFDINRLGQSEATGLGHEFDVYKNRLEAFGWHTLVVNGHDVQELSKAFYEASIITGKPTAIVAKTFKGKDIPGIENELNWHGKPLAHKTEEALAHLRGLLSNNAPHGLTPHPPVEDAPAVQKKVSLSEPPNYKPTDKIATRKAYGTALAKLARNNPRVMGFDCDVKNSTFALDLKTASPEQYVECFIAEQNMVGVAMGASARNRAIAFGSTFACFLSRAFDQLRMGAISMTNANFAGSHVGVSIGEDGPSQMALEDLAMFRSIPSCTVFYPSDPIACERAIEMAANTEGMTYTRTSRPAMELVYTNDEVFEIGKAKVVRQSASDKVTIVGAGVTLNEAIKAYEQLKATGVNVRVFDPFTVKPFDAETLIACAKATGGRVLVVEDHYPEGGLADAARAALSMTRDTVVKSLAIPRLPRSGPPTALMEMYGISASGIVKAVQELLLA